MGFGESGPTAIFLTVGGSRDGLARVADGDGDGVAIVNMGADEVGVISSWHV